jgi:hypothetical protein
MRAASHPQPLSQPVLLELLAGARRHAIEPREHLGDGDRVLFFRCFDADRQSCRRSKRHFREHAPAERGDGFDGGFVEAVGWDADRVLNTLGVGEGHYAEAGGHEV